MADKPDAYLAYVNAGGSLSRQRWQEVQDRLAAKDLSHFDLLSIRHMLPDNDPMQAQVGPMEHEAFAREYVQEHPIRGTLALGAAIPAYTGAKALGLMHGRSPASMSEIVAGYRGMLEGMHRALQSSTPRPPSVLDQARSGVPPLHAPAGDIGNISLTSFPTPRP